jgi:hypothetical protein
MGRLNRPNVFDAESGLRPREIAITMAIIVAFCLIAVIMLL